MLIRRYYDRFAALLRIAVVTPRSAVPKSKIAPGSGTGIRIWDAVTFRFVPAANVSVICSVRENGAESAVIVPVEVFWGFVPGPERLTEALGPACPGAGFEQKGVLSGGARLLDWSTQLVSCPVELPMVWLIVKLLASITPVAGGIVGEVKLVIAKSSVKVCELALLFCTIRLVVNCCE